jgi:peptidoglycan/xylan/chitin deacetylase (PgdA/CDA1 family)
VILGIASISIGLNSVSEAVATASTERVIPIYSVDTKDKVCAISFDAAWGNEQTDDLLDTLDEYEVKTTFFLVGSWVKKYPESVKKIAEKGHDVGNHSSTHAHMPALSADKMKKEITDCNERVKKLTGKSPTLFRAPYGDYDNNVVNMVKSLDMYCVQWNIDSLDWKDPSVEQIVKNCKALADAMTTQGFKLVSGGTDNHLMLVDLTNIPELTGKVLQNNCDEVHITLNRNAIPNDPRSPFITSGVRIGTAAVTTRGFKEEDMKPIAECIWKVATDFENSKDEINQKVAELVKAHPIYEG